MKDNASSEHASAGNGGLSAEVFAIPLEKGVHLLYAPLRRAAFVANARAVNLTMDLAEKRMPDEASDGALRDLLRRLEIVDGGAETSPVTVFGGDPEPTAVTLFLTTTCNLRCTYCYAAAGETPAKTMTMEVAKRAIDFVAANAVRKGSPSFEVAYHGGGEPTVAWRVLTESFTYARTKANALGLTVQGALATNGVLADGQIDWITQNLGGASVSFDGLPEVNDKHRLTVAGKGSSGAVIKTLRRFDGVHFPYGIRVTVTADQIGRLADSVDFICRTFAVEKIQVEPAYQLGRWSQAPSAETTDFIEAYRAAKGRAQAHGRDITYSAARLDLLTNHFCGVTQDNFCVSPDGNVSGCYEVFSEDNPLADRFFYGAPEAGGAGFRFRLPVLNNLRNQAVQHREYCRGCFAKWHCAGDCYHKALTVSGSGEFEGSDRCHITRELVKDEILARISQSGGVFWHEPPPPTTEGSGAPGAAAESRGKELFL